MEANQIAVVVRAGSAGFIQFAAGGGIQMYRGLEVWGCNDVVVAATAIGGAQGYTDKGIWVDGATRLVFLGVNAPSWRLPETGVTLIATSGG